MLPITIVNNKYDVNSQIKKYNTQIKKYETQNKQYSVNKSKEKKIRFRTFKNKMS